MTEGYSRKSLRGEEYSGDRDQLNFFEIRLGTGISIETFIGWKLGMGHGA